jgi:hypothetical protein
LRARIFGAPASAAAPRIRFADFSQWLVPVFGCFLLVIGTLSSRYPAHENYSALPTNILDGSPAYSSTVLAARADHSDKNNVPASHLEWSFGSQTSTTAYPGAVQVSYTNKIISNE